MKRLIAGPLWFLATWFMYELLWSLTGVPRLAGPVLGSIVAVMVWVDPMHLFWPVRADRTAGGIASATFQTSAK